MEGDGLTEKGHKGTFWGDRNDLYFIGVQVIEGVHRSQNSNCKICTT